MWWTRLRAATWWPYGCWWSGRGRQGGPWVPLLDVLNPETVVVTDSTLLRAVAGLDHEAAGSGELTAPQRVSVVFQDSRLLPWRRVLDIMLLGTEGEERATPSRGRGAPHPGGEARSCPVTLRAGHVRIADGPFVPAKGLSRLWTFLPSHALDEPRPCPAAP